MANDYETSMMDGMMICVPMPDCVKFLASAGLCLLASTLFHASTWQARPLSQLGTYISLHCITGMSSLSTVYYQVVHITYCINGVSMWIA
jgi:hypothetical protein